MSDDGEPTRAQVARELLKRLAGRPLARDAAPAAVPRENAPAVHPLERLPSLKELVAPREPTTRTASAVRPRRDRFDAECDLCGDPAYSRYQGRDLCRDCFEDETEDEPPGMPEPDRF